MLIDSLNLFQFYTFVANIKLLIPSIDLSVIKSGTLLAVGTGDCGQLGLGEDMLHRKKPYIVKDLQDRRFRFAVAGAMHTCCLTDENEVKQFGCDV